MQYVCKDNCRRKDDASEAYEADGKKESS